MISRRKRFIATLVATCMLLMATSVSVFAAEPVSAGSPEEVTIVLNEDGSIASLLSSAEARSGYYTFKEFTSGRFTSAQGYSFNLGHACKLKMMWAGKYVDGSSGTMSFTLYGPTAYQEYSMPMDGTARAMEFKGNWFTGTLPPGDYQIQLLPDNHTKEYASAGSVYSLDY